MPSARTLPFFNATMLSAFLMVDNLCAMTSNVFPFINAAILFWIFSSFSGSVNAVASIGKTNIFKFYIIAG